MQGTGAGEKGIVQRIIRRRQLVIVSGINQVFSILFSLSFITFISIETFYELVFILNQGASREEADRYQRRGICDGTCID